MDRYDIEDVVAPPATEVAESPLKAWRLNYLAGTLEIKDIIDFFENTARKYFEYQDENGIVKCSYKEAGAKEGIIDLVLEFIFGDNPETVLEKIRLEGNTTSVCGRVFKNGEPTYSCRECGMDPTCVLCVSCFKQSAHRFHKYKMSTSGGGGCCDCGDEEAWKKDYYCEEHQRGHLKSGQSKVITDAIRERCEIGFEAILTFCVDSLEMERNASSKCLSSGPEDDDNFCTVLYNDESHTFDQVIHTLTKITKCQQKDAMEIVASIDREGRAVVKCDTFDDCCQLKDAINKHSVSANAALVAGRPNQPLMVTVLHIRALSCQQFALQLLSWFQEFLMRHSIFRHLFVRTIMNKDAPYNIKHILEFDVKLWKAARSGWHRLLISGMLMEYENKMWLAQEFSRHYATIVQDFIRDDHEHTLSIVSLSVQLFTVPSIAHHLIAHESIMFKLLHTFYHESIEKHVQNKTLHFNKNAGSLSFFKRAAYILYDLRYVLSFKPEVWNGELRLGFLEGCKVLLRLLNVMQGMESITRQTGQHMDYEPEWECAFNLHIKLASTISLVIDWCASDQEVLNKMYQLVMRYIVNNTFILGQAKIEQKTVAGHVANCNMYDVSSKPVSIHLPLSRLFAGIFLHLGTYGITYDNAVVCSKRTPEEILEPILCTQAMIAQVHSGMWRRNGYSLLHQLYFYRNVRCRAEMLDRDIVGMQIGAALIESNQYLIHILNKFGLIDWMQPNFEENLNSNPTDDDFIRLLSMIDEFLELIIIIIGERYVPGISKATEADRFKKEIVQLLCIKPFSHSELNRALPDTNNDTVLEEVIESAAKFKKPLNDESRGVFELKEELYDDYNLFYYHYTKEDKSKSEETQRLRRKHKNELECCPPPKLPKLTDEFISIANLLQCDVMLEIMDTVLNRALDLKAKSFLENHLQKVLYLIGYGLQEEQSGYYPFLSFYQRAQERKILTKLEELSRCARVDAHRDFIVWIIRKFKEMQSINDKNEDNAEVSNSGNNDSSMSTDEQEKLKKQERTRLAAERRQKILAQMESAQKNFMQSNADMFASASMPTDDAASLNMEWQDDNCEEGAVAYNSIACLGVERRLQQPEDEKYKCILCFEDCAVTKDGPTLVYPAFIQKSKVLPPEPKHNASVHTNSCGHVMHVNCWQEYYNNEETKEQRRTPRNRSLTMPAVNSDFQCPYCRCLSNSVLPLTPSLSKYCAPNVFHTNEEILPLDTWLEVMKSLTEELSNIILLKRDETDEEAVADPSLTKLVSLKRVLNNSNTFVDVEKFFQIMQPIDKIEIPGSWTTFLQHYIKSVRHFSTPNSLQFTESFGIGLMWQSCIYTIQALEMYLRATDKPLQNDMSMRHKCCLSGLIRASCLGATNTSPLDFKYHVLPLKDALGKIFKQNSNSVLEWNPFSIMVTLILMVPNTLLARDLKRVAIPVGTMMDYYFLQLLFLANLTKAIVLFNPKSTINYEFMDVDADNNGGAQQAADLNISDKVKANIIQFYSKYNIEKRRKKFEEFRSCRVMGKVESDDYDWEYFYNESLTAKYDTVLKSLIEHVKMESREFLRCCCLFFHFITDVDFPESFISEGDTFDNMCSYLGLNSNISTYFDNESVYATILEQFASHPDIANFNFRTETRRTSNDIYHITPCCRPIPRLIDLPDDFSDLINGVSDFICPNNEREEMKTPTMCLICGEILCGQSYCCQPELEKRNVGACTYHVNFCSAEIGIFLRIRDCQIIFLGRNKGCFAMPPYLDEYGESDQGLRRGNPLRLCKQRYNKINMMWLGHALHEEIARLNDNSMAVTQWYHM